MPTKLRAQRVTLGPSQEVAFQAGACLSVCGVGGLVSIGGSGSNDIAPGTMVPQGLKLTGVRNPDGTIDPIGVVYFRNESPVLLAYVEVWTGNGDIELAGTVGASQLVQTNDWYSCSINASCALVGGWQFTLAIEAASPKRIKLRSITLLNPGIRGAASTFAYALYQVTANPSGCGGIAKVDANFTRSRPDSPASLATVRHNLDVAPSFGTVNQYAFYATTPTVLADFAPRIYDPTNGGSMEPLCADVGGSAGCGFTLQGGGAGHNQCGLRITWTEE